MFRLTDNKGFQMKFSNGWTVSVQFGNGNYCENRNNPTKGCPSIDAEIAAWDSNNKWYNFGCDEVKGWCSSDEVAKFMEEVSSFPSS